SAQKQFDSFGDSADRMQRALHSARVVVWEFDVGLRTLQYAGNNGSGSHQFFEDEAFRAELLDYATNGAGTYCKDVRVVRPDGAAIWIRNQGEIIRDAEGRPCHVVGVSVDITDHKKRTEMDLEESRRFAQRIAETSLNVLFVYDLVERRNVYANRRSIDIIGYTPEEIEEMGEAFIHTLLHPEDLAQLPALGKEYATKKDGEVFESVFRMRHKNGQWRWVHRCATIFNRMPDGRPKQILGSVTDITEYKHAEQELRALSARLLGVQDEERRRIA